MDSSGFTKETKETYKLLEKCFFDESAAKYTTIVRTHFSGFKNKNKCKQEKDKILENSGDFEKTVEKVRGFIYVDNPPTDVEDEDEKALNKGKRIKSRETLKDYLKMIFEDIDTTSEEDIYKPVNLKKLNEVIGSSVDHEEKLREKKTKLC